MPHPVRWRDFHSSSGSGPYLASFGLSVTTSRIFYLTLYRSYATSRISLAHRGASPETVPLAERGVVASGEQERRTVVKRPETFRSDPEGSNPSRQRPSRPAGSEPCMCVATSRVKRTAACAEAAG